MNQKKKINYHFKKIVSKRADTEDSRGLKKLYYVSDELNNQLFVFLWIDQNNEPQKFQFFFSEKVIDWSEQTGLTTNKTNRLDPQEMDSKIGVQKGLRTMISVNDPTMIDEALSILNESVFPIGIKDILQSRIQK